MGIKFLNGEEETYREERFYNFTDMEISIGRPEGQPVLGDDGVYRYNLVADMQYHQTLPRVDCEDVEWL